MNIPYPSGSSSVSHREGGWGWEGVLEAMTASKEPVLQEEKKKKVIGDSLSCSYTYHTQRETQPQLGRIILPFGSTPLAHLNVECWVQKVEGNPSFSRDSKAPASPISGLKESCWGTQHSLTRFYHRK